MKRYYKHERTGVLVEVDGTQAELDGLIAAGYSRIGRKAWRDYKRLARISAGVSESLTYTDNKLTEAALKVNYEDAMSEEPYL